MATTKSTSKTTATKAKQLSAFEKELLETAKKINEYKEACEANVVSIIYKNPDVLRESNLQLEELSNNIWRVYFQIAADIIKVEKKNVLDDVTIGFYLERHKKLSDKFDEYGGYEKIVNAGAYVQEANFDGYLRDLRRWNAVLKLAKRGFPVQDRLSDFCDMTAEEIYREFEIYLNDIFVNVDNNIQSYNGFEGMKELVDKLDQGMNVGIPLTNCDILNKEIGGLLPGTIVGLGASSGVGKSTLSINYIFPSMIKYNLHAVFIINEEDKTKFQKEALCWYCSNVLKTPVPKHVLRDGHFSPEVKEALYKASEWFENQKDNQNITIIPLENYTSKQVVKIIKKYSQLAPNCVIVLDTLKESYDAREVETWKSVMRDTTDFYDAIKKTTSTMFITYQLTKNRSRYLSNADIGISKGIIDVFSVNLFCRRPLQDEFEGEKHELACYKVNNKSKIPFKLKKDKHYMITFISKNRYGQSDIQIISEADFSVNQYEDKGYCIVTQDF